MKNHPWQFVGIVVLIGTLFIIGNGISVSAQGPETIYITSPTEGEVVSGIVTIAGAVDFPDFVKYEVFLKSDDQLSWAATVYAPVINGNLAFLDTRTFIDGKYQILIRQVHSDSNYTEFIGPTFTIENGLGAPLPHPEIESSPLYPPVAGAVIRLRNCGSHNLEFDYGSPTGFCSAADLWIPFKEHDSDYCPSIDLLVIPCEYRGTAVGEGEKAGASYSFVAEAGKIYEINYPGGAVIYIGEIEGDERASTDTGGLSPDDPARFQSPPETTKASDGAPTTSTEPAAEATPLSGIAAPTASTSTSEEPESVLPVTGQEEPSKILFIGVAIGLILFLILGGAMAVGKRRHNA